MYPADASMRPPLSPARSEATAMRRFPRIPCCTALSIALSITLSTACAAQMLPGRVDDALPPIADASLPLPTDPLLRDAQNAADTLRGELGYALRARTLARE
jgi:hypothetical protein